jgi:hypothetical protein
MDLVDLVALLAISQYLFFGVLVARARGRYGVKAPAVTGHEMFERSYRVQMNTLELLVAFLPALYIAARYWPPQYVAGIGAVYLAGRFAYWRGYVAAPASDAADPGAGHRRTGRSRTPSGGLTAPDSFRNEVPPCRQLARSH